MQANDGLPEMMCVPCVLQVSRAFTFKQQCRRSDQTLRGANTAKQTKIENTVAQVAAEDNVKEHPSQSPIIESETDDLDSQLVLDVLPAEIETTSPFEEEIELSSLPSETQFSPVANATANDAHEMTKENLPTKYFDEIDEQVVSLTVETFGMSSSFLFFLFFLVFIIIIFSK